MFILPPRPFGGHASLWFVIVAFWAARQFRRVDMAFRGCTMFCFVAAAYQGSTLLLFVIATFGLHDNSFLWAWPFGATCCSVCRSGLWGQRITLFVVAAFSGRMTPPFVGATLRAAQWFVFCRHSLLGRASPCPSSRPSSGRVPLPFVDVAFKGPHHVCFLPLQFSGVACFCFVAAVIWAAHCFVLSAR